MPGSAVSLALAAAAVLAPLVSIKSAPALNPG